MLQSIRERTQGWIAGLIISVIILSFALWGIHSYFVSEGTNNVVAEVNGVDITKEQLAIAYERLRRQTQTQFGTNNVIGAKQETVLKLKAIQALTEIEALKQASLYQGFHISSQQIDNYLQNIPDFQVNGRFSMERFQEIISATLMSVSEFLELIKTSLLIDQPKLGIVFTSFALPDEVAQTYALVNQERSIEYLYVPFQTFLSQRNNIVTPSQIETYYREHQKDFMTPEQISAEYIELSFKDSLLNIPINDTILHNFYNENINSYTQPTAWQLASLLIPIPTSSTKDLDLAKHQLEVVNQALMKGEEFKKLTLQYPDKTFNELHPVTLDQIPSILQKTILMLNKNAQYAVVKTKQGFLVIKLINIHDPKVQSFAAVKDKVKQVYLRQRGEEKFAELREKLANLVYEHPDSLQNAAKALNLRIQTTEFFTKNKSGKDISQYKKVRDAAFSNDVLNLQNNSDVIQIHPEALIVLRVKTHVNPTLLALQSITNQIEEKIKLNQAKQLTENFMKKIQTYLTQGKNINSFLAEHRLTWNKTASLGRYSTKIDTAILDLAFRLPVNNQKKIYGMTKLPSGYAIVSVQSVKNVTVDDPKQYTVFAEQVQNSEGFLEYELYKQNELAAAKIKLLTN